MRKLAMVFAWLIGASGSATESGIFEKAVVDGMQMISSGKIPDAMNEIRLGFNCNRYDQKRVSAECIETLTIAISQEKDTKKKAALLVYSAVIMLGNGAADGVGTAIFALDQAEKCDPALPEIYNTRGACYRSQKNLAGAIVDYDKAIALNPNYVDAIANRAEAHWKTGDKDKATADMIRYQRLLGKIYYSGKP